MNSEKRGYGVRWFEGSPMTVVYHDRLITHQPQNTEALAAVFGATFGAALGIAVCSWALRRWVMNGLMHRRWAAKAWRGLLKRESDARNGSLR